MAIVLIGGGGLFEVFLAQQTWSIITLIRNRWLVHHVLPELSQAAIPQHHRVLSLVFPSVWRSGLGQFFGYATTQSIGIFYSQIGDVASIASFLFGLRLIQNISNVSQAPFYSKLPLINRLRAQAKLKQFDSVITRSVFLAHSVFLISIIILALWGDKLWPFIGANVPFPTLDTWLMLSCAFFLERFGAMHLQIHASANKILWHIANGAQGITLILMSLVLYPHYGLDGLLFSLISGYFIYACIGSYFNHRDLINNSLSFELKTAVLPISLTLVFATIGWSASNIF
tara:strand:+ start:5041 stop:5898 length:858 start_codon:yes stop_codon:yes gene_type:complete